MALNLSILYRGPLSSCNYDCAYCPFAKQSDSAEELEAIANNRRLFDGVVAWIAHYGNCFGIPTLAGEVHFDKSYEGNPLVNAFCLGVLRHEQIARGAAKGVGGLVVAACPPSLP